MSNLHVSRRAVLVLASLAATLACAGDGGPSAPGASVSLHLLGDAAAITEANSFSLRLRGASPDSVTAVRIGGADAIAGVSDSTLSAVMPLGPAGSVTLELTAWVSGRSVPASISLTRAAGPSVGDPVAATSTLLADLDADIAFTAALAVPPGVDADAWAAEQADIAALRDSLEAQLGRLDPTSRAIALSLIGQMRDETTALAMANAAAASCNTLNERVACLTGVRVELVKRLRRATAWAVVIGGSTWLLIAGGTLAATTVAAASIAAGIVAALLSYGALEAKQDLSKWVNSTYERAVDGVVRFEGRITDIIAESHAAGDAITASAVAPITMQPNVPRRLPIERLTRSAILGDTFPAVRGIPDSVNLLAEKWNEFAQSLPRPLRITAPTIGTTPVRVRVEPADFSETSIVSIREGGAVSTVTGTLSDAQPGINLTLNGDAGAGRDLTVRLALDGLGAGRVEFDVPVRYEALPDTLDAIRALLEGQRWGWEGAEFVQPWRVTSFVPGSSIAFDYCYGDPAVRVRCFNIRFVKDETGSIGVVITSGFNGNTTGWGGVVISASSIFMQLNPADPNSSSITFTPR